MMDADELDASSSISCSRAFGAALVKVPNVCELGTLYDALITRDTLTRAHSLS